MSTLEHEPLIHKILGNNFLQLSWVRSVVEETPSGPTVKVTLTENSGAGETPVEVEGKGVGVVDALYAGLLARYGAEYQSLKTLQLTGFHVAADIDTKKGQAGVDAVGKVTLEITNSRGQRFSFSDASRSITASTARTVIEMVQYFVNAERAFVTLHNARHDAISRGREDLVARYTAEMAEIVESTSYIDVIK